MTQKYLWAQQITSKSIPYQNFQLSQDLFTFFPTRQHPKLRSITLTASKRANIIRFHPQFNNNSTTLSTSNESVIKHRRLASVCQVDVPTEEKANKKKWLESNDFQWDDFRITSTFSPLLFCIKFGGATATERFIVVGDVVKKIFNLNSLPSAKAATPSSPRLTAILIKMLFSSAEGSLTVFNGETLEMRASS